MLHFATSKIFFQALLKTNLDIATITLDVIFTTSLLRFLEKQNALYLPVSAIFFFSTTFPEYRGIRRKNILQTIEQLIQFSYLLL